MSKVNMLFAQIDALKEEQAARLAELTARVHELLTAQFDADIALQKALTDLECGNGVDYNYHDGGLDMYVRYDLGSVHLRHRQFLDVYLEDRLVITDYRSDCLKIFLGDENYMIQDDTRRDNGVWQGSKLLWDEKEYTDDDGAVNEEKRNDLIESHMEKSGCYPGVFRLTQHGDIFPVSTVKPK
jgi:hypothetical protein